MAFPTTVSTIVNTYHGVGGPWVSSGGNVYILTKTGASTLHMFKATDPASSFANAGTDFVVTSGNTIRQLDGFQVADLIHVVTRDAGSLSTNVLRYHVFDMSTDTWTTMNQLVRDVYTIPQLIDESIVRIRVRSDGTKIILYEGPQVLADVNRARCYYARYMGAAWSADIAIGGGGNAHWYPGEAILANADRIHFMLNDFTNLDAYQQCLTSANALETLPAAFDSVIANDSAAMIYRGVAYSASAGGTVVRNAYFDSFGPSTLNDYRFSSSDAPAASMTITANITSPENSGAGSGRHHGSMAKDGSTVYFVFENSSDDLYITSSQDAGSWSTPLLLQTAQINGRVYANCYNRGSRVVGICYFDSAGSATMYTEYTVSAVAAAPSALGPSLTLLGVGR